MSAASAAERADEEKLSILSVGFPYAVLGPRAVGGAEVICSQVEAAVVSLGYNSLVVGHEGSVTRGRLYGTRVPAGTVTDEVRAEVEASQQEALDRALAENSVALVHMHGLDFDRYRVPAEVPVLVTLHLPPAWYSESIWELPANYHFVCVSESQQAACPVEAQGRIAVVQNGVALPDGAVLRSEGRYALMLARICPEKNVHAGLEAARTAGLPALLAGEVYPYEAHQRYFEDEVAPRLTTVGRTHEGRGHQERGRVTARFLGPVTGEEKTRLIARAACLLQPSLAPETSSLVAMEALACGVPVIGMAVGAVPEIVEDGRTGFLIQPGEHATEQMAAALGQVLRLDRGLCRSVAEERFPLSRMLEGYGRLYRQLANDDRRSASTKLQREPVKAVRTVSVSLVIEEVRDGAALHALGDEWISVWHGDPKATPFQHPAWLLPWWRQFGPDGELHALALRDAESGGLCGLLPLYVYRRPEHGDRQLLLLGAGTTDYLDGVWAGDGNGLADRALVHVRDEMCGWDVASLHQLRSQSAVVRAANRLGMELRAAEPCAVLDTADDLPGKIRVNARRYRRKAEAEGELCCEVARTAEEALASFEALVQLHSRRWEERGEEGVLHDPRVLAHHRESLPLLLEAGLLCLLHLKLAGETMGVLYALADSDHVSQRRLYLYLIGFDARYAVFSPGTLLVDEAWKYAREHGLAKVDLLRGGEDYKQFWGARPEGTLALELQRDALGMAKP